MREGGGRRGGERERERELVSWYFEPSHPQRITLGLKQTSICLLFTLHTSHQTTNSIKKKHEISPETNLHKTKHTQTSKQNFRRLVPSVLPLLKKAHKARTCWYRGPFRRFINTRIKKNFKYKKGMDRSNEFFLMYYINAQKQIPVPYGSLLLLAAE